MNILNNFIKLPNKVIMYNKSLRNYYIFNKFETGISLLGWEINSLRHQRVEMSKSYVSVYKKEIFINNLYIQPLNKHFHYKLLNNDYVNRKNNYKKLLLHKKEISLILNKINQKGYTLILLCLYWKNNLCKTLISIAKGKKLYDKRKEQKNKEWNLHKQRLIKNKM